MKRMLMLTVTLLLLTAPAYAQQTAPPRPAAAQDGFVPVDSPIAPGDAIPAPRLVAIAYGFIWLTFFGYLVSIKMRLTKTEKEIETVSRRAGAGGGRA